MGWLLRHQRRIFPMVAKLGNAPEAGGRLYKHCEQLYNIISCTVILIGQNPELNWIIL